MGVKKYTCCLFLMKSLLIFDNINSRHNSRFHCRSPFSAVGKEVQKKGFCFTRCNDPLLQRIDNEPGAEPVPTDRTVEHDQVS